MYYLLKFESISTITIQGSIKPKQFIKSIRIIGRIKQIKPIGVIMHNIHQ